MGGGSVSPDGRRLWILLIVTCSLSTALYCRTASAHYSPKSKHGPLSVFVNKVLSDAATLIVYVLLSVAAIMSLCSLQILKYLALYKKVCQSPVLEY